MGEVRFGAPKDLVRWLRDQLGAKVFVESGTFQAGTTRWAATEFEKVITIEAAPALHEAAKVTLQPFPHVSALLGASSEHLGQLALTLETPAVFWLDAHWSGGETSMAEGECPLMAELEALKPLKAPSAFLIDDARFFLRPPTTDLNAEQWPGLVDLIPLLSPPEQPRYVAVYEDVILAVPVALEKAAKQWIITDSERAVRHQEAMKNTSVLQRGLRFLQGAKS